MRNEHEEALYELHFVDSLLRVRVVADAVEEDIKPVEVVEAVDELHEVRV